MKKYLLIFLCIGNWASAQVIIDPSLKAYYPFDGNAKDASGNKNNPIFNNATLTKDRFGKPNSAYHFNGINQYMRIPNSATLNLKNQITLSVWIRPTGFYHGICHASAILSKGGGNYLPGDYALRFDDALISSGMGCGDITADTIHQNFRGTGTVLNPYTPYIKKNQWYSVIYTNDGTSARLYVDCDLKYSVTFSETFSNTEDLFLGKSNDPYFKFWMNADLDDIRIYDRAFTEDEIAAPCGGTPKKKVIPEKKPVTEIIPVPKKEIEPEKKIELETRTNELMRQITVDHDSISIDLYDNGEIDGDSVTLIYNDQILTTHQLLTDKAKRFIIKVAPGNIKNELVMYAENLGSIPPNTALMVIYDGDNRYEVNVRSTKSTNGAVRFKLRE
ncbi:MAG: LamG domain-containing protein [Sphingobacteriales bacterium]|nr:LamG domain-containing protein [Sphingobacteriales bacterium]